MEGEPQPAPRVSRAYVSAAVELLHLLGPDTSAGDIVVVDLSVSQEMRQRLENTEDNKWRGHGNIRLTAQPDCQMKRRRQVVTFQRRVTRLLPSRSSGLTVLQKVGAADGASGGRWERASGSISAGWLSHKPASICSSNQPSFHLSVRPYSYPLIHHPSVINPSAHPSIHPSLLLSVHSSTHIHTQQSSINHPSIYKLI